MTTFRNTRKEDIIMSTLYIVFVIVYARYLKHPSECLLFNKNPKAITIFHKKHMFILFFVVIEIAKLYFCVY